MKMGVDEISGNAQMLFPKMNDVEYNHLYWQNNEARQKEDERRRLRKQASFDFNECLRTLRERTKK